MELIQRFGSNIDDKYVDEYINAILKHKKSCDTVWLATKYGFPKLETHKKYAQYLKTVSDKLRANGIKVSLQLSNSIGHGIYMSSADCTGLVYDNSPVRQMVGPDGVLSPYCFCWRGDELKEYLVKELTYYVQAVKPDVVWVDDDFRAQHHSPIDFGCFCDDCIKTFNEKHSASFTREELVEEFLHGDLKWRERYIQFIREGMYELMCVMTKAIVDASPNTEMGLQHGPFGAYTGFGCDFVFDAMKDKTGKNPKSRPGGGAYDDHDPNGFIKKAIVINWQNATLPDYVECKCPEIENLPFCVFGKSPEGTALETTYYLANGNTDMSYSMIMNMNEPMEWHENELELFSKHRAYWEKLSEINKSSYQAGMRFFISKYAWQKKLDEQEGLSDMENEHYSELYPWTRDAIPIAYDKKEDSVFILHPECANALSASDIEYLMSKSVLTDGETIDILQKRGYDFGITVKEFEAFFANSLQEIMTDNSINGSFKKYKPSKFVQGRSKSYAIEKCDLPHTTLGTYKKVYEPQGENTCYGIADAIVETPKGAKWGIISFMPWKGIMPFSRREQILNIADYISNNNLCARLLTPRQAVLLPRKDNDGKTVCVSVLNPCVGESGVLEVLIRNPKSEDFYYMSQYSGEGKLEFTETDDGFIVKLPSIKPWSVATIFAL